MGFVCVCVFFNLYFMCTIVLPACMSVYHIHATPLKVRKGHPIPLGLELVTVVSHDVGSGG